MKSKRMDWFSLLFGFPESEASVREKFVVDGCFLKCRDSKFCIGEFSTPSVKQLKKDLESVANEAKPSLKINFDFGDVSVLHGNKEYRLATFQVASQFNCLEFATPDASPELGIAGYEYDRTQGPACSISCGAATAYRNYFHKWTDRNKIEHEGQTKDYMINNLEGLEDLLVEPPNTFFTVSGGYIFATPEQLQAFHQKLASDRGEYKDSVRVGVHHDVQVTSTNWGQKLMEEEDQLVTQVFGSACSIAYNRCSDLTLWEPLARLVLDASYEAVLMAAILNADRHGWKDGSNKVVLTMLGGGVFGNPLEWIIDAIRKSCKKMENYNLNVVINLYSIHDLTEELQQLSDEFQVKGVGAASTSHNAKTDDADVTQVDDKEQGKAGFFKKK